MRIIKELRLSRPKSLNLFISLSPSIFNEFTILTQYYTEFVPLNNLRYQFKRWFKFNMIGLDLIVLL
jgi:hypothetical protein